LHRIDEEDESGNDTSSFCVTVNNNNLDFITKITPPQPIVQHVRPQHRRDLLPLPRDLESGRDSPNRGRAKSTYEAVKSSLTGPECASRRSSVVTPEILEIKPHHTDPIHHGPILEDSPPVPFQNNYLTSYEMVDQYILKNTIGSGSFSKVKLAVHCQTGEKIAIKMIDQAALVGSSRLRKTVTREIELLRSVKHKYVVKFIDVIETATHLCILMEWVPGGELFHYVAERTRLEEAEAKKFMWQLIQVIHFLHLNGIVHRDLKLENILVDTRGAAPHIRLVDFGLARRFLDSNLLTTRCGSEEYAAPEIIRGNPYDGRQSDIWSFGIIMYATLFGSLPFNPEPNRPKALYDKICNCLYRIPEGIVSVEAQSLIRSILKANPHERATITDIIRHPWFNTP
jgi:5'-AMP-activated protein kinase, catalytic alpha subunit